MSTQRQPEPRTVDQTIEIAASPEAVWKALTDAEELMRWFPLEARTTPGVGGEIWMSWGEHYEHASEIEAWEPGRHLKARFPMSGKGALSTDYYLEGAGGKTILRVVTSGFGAGEDWDDDYQGVTHGWAFELQGLRHYLENHTGRERRVARLQKKLTAPREDLWPAIVGQGAFIDGGPFEAGSEFAVTIAGEPFTGTVIRHSAPTQLVATLDQLGNALFRLEVESHGPGDLWMWVSTYGVDEARVRDIERRWTAGVERIFAEVGG